MSNIIANRKFAWAAGIILTVLYFGPSLLHLFAPAPLRPAPSPPQKMGKPSTRIPATNGGVPLAFGMSARAPAEVAAPPSPLAVADDPALAKFLGTWQGGVALKRGTCSFKLDVRDSHDKDNPFAGFSSLSCAPTMLEMLHKSTSHKQTPAGMVDDMMKQTNPTTAILEGSLVNGSVQFQAQKNFGVTEISNGCAMNSLTLIPFAEQMEADWKESQQGICQGGQMLLKRVPR
jgi:energy-converting hydrogenase Eha subunit F